MVFLIVLLRLCVITSLFSSVCSSIGSKDLISGQPRIDGNLNSSIDLLWKNIAIMFLGKLLLDWDLISFGRYKIVSMDHLIKFRWQSF